MRLLLEALVLNFVLITSLDEIGQKRKEEERKKRRERDRHCASGADVK